MRTSALVLCLAASVLETPALAGPGPRVRAREVRSNRQTGPNMQWFWGGPGGGPRPVYDPRTRVYYRADGSVAAYPVRVRPCRWDYVYPRR